MFWIVVLTISLACLLLLKPAKTQRYVCIAGGLLGLTALSWGVWGHYTAIKEAQAQSETQLYIREALLEAPRDYQALIGRLQALEERLPNRAQAWITLGQSYGQLEAFDHAIWAYQRASELSDIEALRLNAALGLVNAFFMRDNGNLGPQALAALTQAQDLAPEHPGVMNLQAVAAFEQADYERAAELWALVKAQTEDWHLQSNLTQAIAKALEAQVAQGQRNDWVGHVDIRLAKAFEGAVAADDVVYLIVRSKEQRMPWVALRQRASDLPVTLRVTDSMGMYPLSDKDRLEVQAVLSKAGRPVPEAKILESAAEAWPGGEASMQLIISKRSEQNAG